MGFAGESSSHGHSERSEHPDHSERRDLGAHVHGSGSLSIAFDEKVGRVEFEFPAESIVGFEHAAKTAADQKTVTKSIRNFESQIGKLIQMDPSLKCAFKKEKAEMVPAPHGKHADFVAHFSVQCQKPVVGHKVNFDFRGFPGIQKVEVTLLAGDIQKAVTVRKKPVQVDFK